MAFDVDKLTETLRRNARNPNCPWCGTNDWVGIPNEMRLQKVNPDGDIDIGAGMPLLAFLCNTCGFTRLHSIPALERRGQGN